MFYTLIELSKVKREIERSQNLGEERNKSGWKEAQWTMELVGVTIT